MAWLCRGGGAVAHVSTRQPLFNSSFLIPNLPRQLPANRLNRQLHHYTIILLEGNGIVNGKKQSQLGNKLTLLGGDAEGARTLDLQRDRLAF